MHNQFHLQHFTGNEDTFHIARVTVHSRHDLSLHNHDYAEIFWIESGSGYHIINGKQVLLNPGSLVMIRPDDEHTFNSSQTGLTIMNVAFPADTLTYLHSRYFTNTSSYFWINDPLPYHITLDMDAIKNISQNAEKIWRHTRSKFYLDTLLLFIFGLIADDKNLERNSNAPAWLLQTVQRYNTPQCFKQGARGFAALCQKNIDHVNKVVRLAYEKTLSELVTELRMSFAAKQLSMTNAPIKLICDDCGFNNLGHFYKTFKSIYGQTPVAYRESNQTII